MDEVFNEIPKKYLLQIYLDEILKKAPYSARIQEKVETIKQLLGS